MVNSYYTLRALVDEWRSDLVGCTVGDVYSQVRNELSLAFAHPEQEWTLRCSVQQPLLYLFRTAGYSKARRNVATLFRDAFDRRVTGVRIAERDRMVFVDLAGGYRFQLLLFGSKANVFLVDDSGTIVEAFQGDDRHCGTDPPTPRPAPMPDTFAAFEDRWRANRNSTRQALQGTFTLFGPPLARETIRRAGVTAETPEACTEADRHALFEAGQALRGALADPEPRIYAAPDAVFPDALALLPFDHRAGDASEAFDTVDRAVRVFVKRRLAEAHFHRLYDPLEEALEEAAEHYQASAERIMEELTNESRAQRYERWGHLLKAHPHEVPADADEVTLPDLFEEGDPVTIPLDPAKSAIENAEHYYDRARRTRRSREEAEARMVETQERAETAQALLEELREVETLDAVKRFRKENADRLAPFVEQKDEDLDRFPFRRFELGGGFEVWVGKNARQNDELTFHTAQKYDLWMHARGVPGSHTVLHLPNRDAEPGPKRKRTAAAIAAYYSKARGSGLVPVMVTRRKYVRSPSGSPPGAVRVEREEVLLVEPHLPN